jgi:hypothetical protein
LEKVEVDGGGCWLWDLRRFVVIDGLEKHIEAVDVIHDCPITDFWDGDRCENEGRQGEYGFLLSMVSGFSLNQPPNSIFRKPSQENHNM